MMMDCPRCGFSQPKDRYCANCGLDVEHYREKPKPWLIRLLQNPNLHLSLIGLLLVIVVLFLIVKRQEMLARHFSPFRGTPLSSKEAGDPDQEPGAPAIGAVPEPPAAAPAAAPVAANPAAVANNPSVTDEKAAPATEDPKKLDLSFWELPREVLATQLAGAERVAEGSAGHAYLLKDGTKLREALRGGRKLSAGRSVPLQNGQQLLVMTPAATQEPFQFALAAQLSKWENKEATLRFDSQLVLPQPETAQEMASPTPVLKAAVESNLAGGAQIGPNAILVLVLEPSNRHPRDEYINKAGDGPWAVFSSETFRHGTSEWVSVLQLK